MSTEKRTGRDQEEPHDLLGLRSGGKRCRPWDDGREHPGSRRRRAASSRTSSPYRRP